MTPGALAERVDALLVAMGEPAGTLVVHTRADAIFGREATIYRPDGKVHMLFTVAMGEDDEGACDLAWAKIRVAVDGHFAAATQRLGRAEIACDAARREVTAAVDALTRAGALRRAVRA